MKHFFSCVLIFMLLLVTIATVGCSKDEEPPSDIPPDIPSLSDKEVCAMVYNYLQYQVDDMAKGPRMHMQSTLNKAAPSCRAVYMGKGRWSVNALGYGYNTQEEEWYYYYTGGQWNVYEASGIVEPSNTKARNLLQHCQRYKD